jgi:hypothetical protein
MSDAGIRKTIDELLAIDASTADRAGLGEIASLAVKVRSWLDAVDVAVTRRSRQLSPASMGGSAPTAEAADTISANGRRSPKDARAAAGRAGICDRMAGFEAALIGGEVSAGHVDAIADASRGLDAEARAALDQQHETLLAAAKEKSVVEYQNFVRDRARECAAGTGNASGEDELERQRRKNRLSRWVDKATGMHKLLAEVDPVTAATIWGALDSKLETIKQREGTALVPVERLLVDALVEIVTSPTGDPDERRVPEIHVHVDVKTLTDGLHEHSLCELTNGTTLPVSTVMRLCCEADIVPIIMGPDGQPLDAGRTVRTANRKQRRLLRNMYSTCAHPHCEVPFDHCQIHHVVFWERWGLTDLGNLVPLCLRHHHVVHEGGWRLVMAPDRVITLYRPDGSVAFTGNTCDRTIQQRKAVAARQDATAASGAGQVTGTAHRDRPAQSNGPAPPGDQPAALFEVA